MESAEHDRNARRAERTCEVERARILVGLDAHQPDHAEIAVAPEAAQELRNFDPGIGLVDDLDIDRDVGAEHLPFRAIHRNAVQRGERIGRDQRPATSG